MKFTILQMPKSIWYKNNGIFDEESYIQLEDYCAVWTDTVPENINSNEIRTLDTIFEIFNLGCPENYAGRSLSAGDIVKLNSDYYLCCSFGWSIIK